MNGLLVDNNLPDCLPCWRGEKCQFVKHLGPAWTDTEIWNYARQHDLTIVTKDSDFSHRILASTPPPRVLHLRIHNQRLHQLDDFMAAALAQRSGAAAGRRAAAIPLRP